MSIFQESLNIGELDVKETINRTKLVFKKYKRLTVYLNVLHDENVGGLTTRFSVTPPAFNSSPSDQMSNRLISEEQAIQFMQDVYQGLDKLIVHSGNQPRSYYQYLLYLKYITDSYSTDVDVREQICKMFPFRSEGSEILPSTMFYNDLNHALVSFAYSFKSNFLVESLVVYK